MQVLEATGFAQGLFTDEELDSNNLKDKGPKVTYLEKIINLVGIQCGLYCPVRACRVRFIVVRLSLLCSICESSGQAK